MGDFSYFGDRLFGSFGEGKFWFRIFGHGIYGEKMPRFTIRIGRRKHIKLFGYYITRLRP